MENLELRELSDRTGIPVRRLRYVLDHELVPFRDWFLAEGEVGQPRRFDTVTAVFIACAAFMLEAGHKRDAVRDLMKAAMAFYPEGRNPLHLPLIANGIIGTSTAHIISGDGTHVRLIIGKRDSGWISAETPTRREKSFHPRVSLDIDLGQIRDLVQKSE